MSFVPPSLRDALNLPSTKVPVSATAFASYVFPPVLSSIIMAVLAIRMPQTRRFRIALWPLVALLAFRATVVLDVSLGDPDRASFNVYLMFYMLSIAARTFCWTWEKEPLVRYHRLANTPSTIMDALDLLTNFRGHGWNWSHGLYVPRETRPTNRIAFGFYTLFSAVVHALMCCLLGHALRTFVTSTGSNPSQLSIFDDTLPLFVRHLRASIITVLVGFTAYSALQLYYDLLTVPCVLVLGQDPVQWPPVFDRPWLATSLCDFWGRRWHQLFRQIFLLGSYPLGALFGRPGGIIGTFLASALCHHIMMITFGGSEGWRMFISFGMMGPGVLAERSFYKVTGRKVSGTVGWVWTMSWLLLLGSVMAEGFLKGGMFAFSGAVPGLAPVQLLIENLVVGFDAWLHTI